MVVSLPCTPFGLAEEDYTPAKAFGEAGGVLAIATDLNPGTAWRENMQFAIALACRYMHLTPAQAIASATINAAAAIGLTKWEAYNLESRLTWCSWKHLITDT